MRASPPSPARRLALAALSVLFAALLVLAACASEATTEERIIVSGASGQLGGLVVEELLARGVAPERLILVSRTPEALARYAAMGASTRYGDFAEPESLEAAYAGGARMLLISINTFGERPALHGNAIDAAVRAGVRHIAYTSWVDVDNPASTIGADHFATEELLRASGVAWTMLRNQLYMDGLVAQAARMLETGRVVVQPNAPLTGYVARADCAAAAAAVLSTPGHENTAYSITGPAAIGAREIALAASEVTGIAIEIIESDGPSDGPGGAGSAGAAGLVSTAVAELTGRPAMSIVDLLEANRTELLAATAP